MKDKIKQIEYLDKILLPIFGFSSITDYKTTISIDLLTQKKTIITELNGNLDSFKKVFPVREFSLHKSDNEIKTVQQAFCILKKCLQICNVLFDIEIIKNKSFLRLLQKNIVLDEYIKNYKMTDIRNSLSINKSEYDETDDKKIKHIDYIDVINGVKKTDVKHYIVPLHRVYKGGDIDISNYFLGQDISSLIVNIESIKINDISIITQDIIENHLYGSKIHLKLGGNSIYTTILKKDTELVCNICPFSIAKYHIVELSIIPKNIEIINAIKNMININITIKKVIFKKSLYKKLFTHMVNIPWYNNNILRFFNGMCGLGYSEKIDNMKQKFVGNDYQINELKCIHITGDNKEKTCALASCMGYDMASFDEIQLFDCDGYEVTDDHIILKKKIIRRGTTISSIELLFDNCNIIGDIDINIHGLSVDNHVIEQINYNKYKISNINDENQFNLINMYNHMNTISNISNTNNDKYHINIRIDKTNDIDKILDSTKFYIKYCVYSPIITKKIASNISPIITDL